MTQIASAAQFFTAYAKLPRKAQRKTDEFIRKFMADPKQSSIHYEPLQNVADGQLRSVRIGDDYRAIIRAPESGDVFLMLWVDHHDEAYRWAANKRTEIHPATGAMQKEAAVVSERSRAQGSCPSLSPPGSGASLR